jgi:hypothetical protein
MIRDTNYKRNFNSGLGSYVQLLVGRKFSEAFTLQLSPILIHRDSVYPGSTNNTFAIGTGFRLKISRRTSINADYYFVFNKDVLLSVAYNPLSIGFDIETGGHVFQLHFTNATGMNEREFITETRNRWSKGEVVFGFNISRSFQVKKRNI